MDKGTVFGMSFYEWMALIGGYPTIFSTMFLFTILFTLGIKTLFNWRSISTMKKLNKGIVKHEEELFELLQSCDFFTRWRFKRYIGEHEYKMLIYSNS
jgi:hypothetical protein